MERYATLLCPGCGRRWSKHVEEDSKATEEECRDCLTMPGWHKDFDSPPANVDFAVFKRTGKKPGDR